MIMMDAGVMSIIIRCICVYVYTGITKVSFELWASFNNHIDKHLPAFKLGPVQALAEAKRADAIASFIVCFLFVFDCLID